MRMPMPLFLSMLISSSLVVGCASSMNVTPKAVTPVTPAASVPGTSLQTLAGSHWIAPAMPVSTMSASATPKLNFISLTQVGGHGGCNNFGGDAVISGDTMRLGPFISTRKFCEGPAMAVEVHFFKALDSVRSARIVDAHLELMDATGAVVLRLARGE